MKLRGDVMDVEGRRLAQHLVEAERHVSEGERLVAHQRRTVEKRLRDGHHAELPMQSLEEMEESLRLHIQDRDRLRREWASNPRLGGLQGESATAAAQRS